MNEDDHNHEIHLLVDVGMNFNHEHLLIFYRRLTSLS